MFKTLSVVSLLTITRYQRIRTRHGRIKSQTDQDQLQKLVNRWFMEFHPSKCQVISITNEVKPIIGNHRIHDHILGQVHCAKYLGIYIDSKITFNKHVDINVKNPTQHVPSLPEVLLGAAEKSSRWLMLPTSEQLWNMTHDTSQFFLWGYVKELVYVPLFLQT